MNFRLRFSWRTRILPPANNLFAGGAHADDVSPAYENNRVTLGGGGFMAADQYIYGRVYIGCEGAGISYLQLKTTPVGP